MTDFSQTPPCRLPPEDEQFFLRASDMGLSPITLIAIAKDLCAKNGLPWIEVVDPARLPLEAAP